MSRIIAVANQKGGVGKTTTAINLSACLAQAGKKVLVIDFDPQANTTSGLGLDKHSLKSSVYHLLLGHKRFDQVVAGTMLDGLQILPTCVELAGAEIELIDIPEREFILRRIMVDVKYTYDFILIDCPPSLNILTVNALAAADTVLVPIQCEYFALEGLSQLLRTVDLVRKRLNKRLNLEGVVFTMYDPRTNLSAEVVAEVKKHLQENVYNSIIPRNVRLSEAPSHGLPITIYDAKSKGSEAYRALAQEVINRS
ncbi:MAG: AAA family ATPase [Clostridiales bacterium]|jgi:chromosome partitioning protein|nr:AAA family ATPase [Clostridiales bacterium]